MKLHKTPFEARMVLNLRLLALKTTSQTSSLLRVLTSVGLRKRSRYQKPRGIFLSLPSVKKSQKSGLRSIRSLKAMKPTKGSWYHRQRTAKLLRLIGQTIPGSQILSN